MPTNNSTSVTARQRPLGPWSARRSLRTPHPDDPAATEVSEHQHRYRAARQYQYRFSQLYRAFATGNMLQIVCLSVLFGLAVAQFREHARPLLDTMDLCVHAVFGVIGLIISTAPIAVFGAVAFSISRYGIATLMPLAKLAAVGWIVSTFFIVAVLGAIATLAQVNLQAASLVREEILMTSALRVPRPPWRPAS